MSARQPLKGKSPSTETTRASIDWVSPLLATAKLAASVGESTPFPAVGGVLGLSVILLESIQKARKNREDLRELCEDIATTMNIIREEIAAHGESGAEKFKNLCEKLYDCLEGACDAVQKLEEHRGLVGRLKEIGKASRTADQLLQYQRRIQKLREDFMLRASLGLSFQMDRLTEMKSLSVPPPTKFNNCPPASKMFQGRQAILDKMQEYFANGLENQHVLLLHGLGGSGKTQIARKFIQRSAAQFSNIFSLDASTTQTIERSFENIAVAKQVGSTAPHAVMHWLTSQSNWLLFFDNADNIQINLNTFFPSCNHGNILITSRNIQLAVHAESCHCVSDMEEADAIQLLLRTAAYETTAVNTKLATGIVKELCYLPLAITQAGAFISKSRALDSYLELYHSHQARLLSEVPAQSHDDYAWTVYTTWKISFDQLSHSAATLFQLCAFLHHTGISEQIFRYASNYQRTSCGPSEEDLTKPMEFLSHFKTPNGTWDPILFIGVRTELLSYSLITFNSEAKTFSIHPLVHSWIHSTMDNPEPFRLCIQAITAMIMVTTDTDPQAAEKADLVYPQLDSLLGDKTQVTPDFNMEYGLLCFQARKFEQAAKLFTVALQKRRAVLGEHDPQTLVCTAHLAGAYHSLGRIAEAERLQLVVVEQGSQLLGEDHRLMVLARSVLGSIYWSLGRFKDAETLLAALLPKVGGEQELEIHILEWLALTYNGLGQFNKAEKLQDFIVETRRKSSGENHPRTLIALTTLAAIYSRLQWFDKAEKLAAENLDRQEKVIGQDHVDTLRTKECLALIYRRQGRLEQAAELQVTVLKKRKSFLGDNHPDTLGAMSTLGCMYTELGRPADAEQLQVIAYEKEKELLPENCPELLRCMGNLAWTYYKLARFEEAEELGALTARNQRKVLGDSHPDTKDTVQHLKEVRERLGILDEAN